MIQSSFRWPGPRGGEIRGDVRAPQGPPPRSCVVVVHGFKGFKDWGFLPWVCQRLVAEGHSVVSFNFTRNGVGTDGESFTELSRFAENTLTRELDELHRVVERVREGTLLPRPPRLVGVLGYSRGGAEAVLLAREREDLDALVTWSAVATFDRWSEATVEEWRRSGTLYVLSARTGQQLPVSVSLLEDFETNRERLDVEAAAREVRIPWLIVHGTRDLTVDVREARRLARAAPGARMVLVEEAGHTYEVGHPFREASPSLTRALRDTVLHFREHLTYRG